MSGMCRVRSAPRISSASSKPSISGIWTSSRTSATSWASSTRAPRAPERAVRISTSSGCEQRAQHEQVLLEVVDEQARDPPGRRQRAVSHGGVPSQSSGRAAGRRSPASGSTWSTGPARQRRFDHRRRLRLGRILDHVRPPAALHRGQAGGAVLVGAGQQDRRAAARRRRPPPTRTARRPTAANSAPARRPRGRWPGRRRPAGGSRAARSRPCQARSDPCPAASRTGTRALRAEDVDQQARPLARQVQHDEDRRAHAGRQRRQHHRQRLDAARGRADHDGLNAIRDRSCVGHRSSRFW